MALAFGFAIPMTLLLLATLAGGTYLMMLVIRALRKYLRSGEVRREKSETRRSLSRPNGAKPSAKQARERIGPVSPLPVREAKPETDKTQTRYSLSGTCPAFL